MPFSTIVDSHAHSLQTLNTLYQYDDFMSSIGSMIDLGCGEGADLEWWATATTRDEVPRPLNIRCVGVDVRPELPMARNFSNVTYQRQDFEQEIHCTKKFNLVWCHDSFQYVINPLTTLEKWRSITNRDAMMVLILPQTTNMEFKVEAFDQPDLCYYHWTMTSLIHALAITGWDCKSGYFLKQSNDPWLHAVVYNSGQPSRDPRTTRWYDLVDAGLLPESAEKSILKHGYLRQRDLVLPWLDKSLAWFGQSPR